VVDDMLEGLVVEMVEAVEVGVKQYALEMWTLRIQPEALAMPNGVSLAHMDMQSCTGCVMKSIMAEVDINRGQDVDEKVDTEVTMDVEVIMDVVLVQWSLNKKIQWKLIASLVVIVIVEVETAVDLVVVHTAEDVIDS